jgi:RNA recognition motif-containing protein
LSFIADFRIYFEKYGKVLTAEVMFNRETHKSRGFGFIVFEHEESAEKVCAEKEHIISGKLVSKVYIFLIFQCGYYFLMFILG